MAVVLVAIVVEVKVVVALKKVVEEGGRGCVGGGG